MKVLNYERVFDGKKYDCVEVYLPKTTLLIISTNKGFVMCGALDTDIYCSQKMIERGVLCAKAVGVKTIEELYNSNVFSASTSFYQLGVFDGMPIKEALSII